MTEILTGGCLCGTIRYTAKPDQTLHYLCHCSDCQKYSGAPYHAAIVVDVKSVDVDGTMRVFVKEADSGRSIARHYCGECGGHLFTSPWPQVTRLSVKAGTLDEPELFRPKHEIWRQSAQPWADRVAGADQHEQGFPHPVGIGAQPKGAEEDKF